LGLGLGLGLAYGARLREVAGGDRPEGLEGVETLGREHRLHLVRVRARVRVRVRVRIRVR